jgi:hypothetical protein
MYIHFDVWWYSSCSKWLILKRRDVGGGSPVRGLVKDLDLADIIFICRRSSVRLKGTFSVFIDGICAVLTSGRPS